MTVYLQPPPALISIFFSFRYLLHNFLNIQLSSLGLLDGRLVRRKLLLQLTPRSTELINQLCAATNVQLRLHHAIEISPNGLEELSLLDSLNKIVGLSKALNLVGGFEGQNADLLVSPSWVSTLMWRLRLSLDLLLSGNTHSDQAHDDVLSDHERELGHDVGVDLEGEDDETLCDVLQGDGDGIGEEEHLGDVNSSLGSS